ncbi:hypothetical protein PTW35_25840 (plasmid) [Photobacterium sp. DA100]|uniref:hypothetical protein n=1 Tax=Photobacterium sp. DA100 TaxID=3027472 RepID=UPI002479B15F|nr:hypothetical protein [Photobacterium sp. DA100]WEM44680.1 hypothetical protein PTW35_25840 [Photobacterium sp. DA100]
MQNASWKINQGDALTRFLVSPPIQRRFGQFEEHETMVDRVQYKFKNGFVDVGDLPCRKVFWQSMANRTVSLDERVPTEQVYFANGCPKVDFSGFIHIPTHVQRWAETILTVAEAGQYRFRLATCGGVRIWVNDQLTCSFTPFQRNTEQETDVVLPLQAGANQVVIHAEELYERDTQFLFELTSLDPRPITATLANIDSEQLATLESFVSQLVFEMNVADHTLRFDSASQLQGRFEVSGTVTGMSNEEETHALVSPQTIDEGNALFRVDLPASLKPAHYSVALRFDWQGIEITRHFGINIMPGAKALSSSELIKRKRDALCYTANEGMDITGKLLALLELNLHPDKASSILNRTLQKISVREDCSDFWMVSVLWAWHRHSYTQLPDKLWDRARSSILGYRYWLDEPGNDSMWFWSENHVLCFHVSQLLAGQCFPREQFLCSGRTGRQQQDIATERLHCWFDHILEHGLTEWNSSCYYPIDYIGLFALYELAECPSIREKAKTVIDRLMLMGALHYQEGVAGGTMGRVYEKELMANEMTELAGFGHVAWGQGWHTRMCASLPMFCLSQYQPSALSHQVATLSGRETVEAYYTQGMDRCAKVTAWKQPGVTLSCVVDHQTGQAGHQQHVLDVQFAHNPKARLWINHPGEDVPGGDGRPSYWAGNGILPRVMQHKQSAMMVYDLGSAPRRGFTHLYLPTESLDEVVIDSHWCFVRSGLAYAVIGASSPIEMVETGITRGREVRCYGAKTAWYVSVGTLDDDFGTIIRHWKQKNIVLRGKGTELTATVTDPDDQTFSLSWQGECYINEQPWVFPEFAGVNPIIK